MALLAVFGCSSNLSQKRLMSHLGGHRHGAYEGGAWSCRLHHSIPLLIPTRYSIPLLCQNYRSYQAIQEDQEVWVALVV